MQERKKKRHSPNQIDGWIKQKKRCIEKNENCTFYRLLFLSVCVSVWEMQTHGFSMKSQSQKYISFFFFYSRLDSFCVVAHFVHLWASYKVNKHTTRVWLQSFFLSPLNERKSERESHADDDDDNGDAEPMWWSAGVSIFSSFHSYACISHIVDGIKCRALGFGLLRIDYVARL